MASALLLTQGVGSRPDGFSTRAALFQASRVVDPRSFNRKDLQTPNKLRSPHIRSQPAQPILKVHDQVVTQLASATNPATADPASYNKNDLQSFSKLKSPVISNPSNEKRYQYFHGYFKVDTNEGDALVVPNGFDAIVQGLTSKGYSQEFVNSFLSNLQFKQRSRLTGEQQALYDKLLGHHLTPDAPAKPTDSEEMKQRRRDDDADNDDGYDSPNEDGLDEKHDELHPTTPVKQLSTNISPLEAPATPREVDDRQLAMKNVNSGNPNEINDGLQFIYDDAVHHRGYDGRISFNDSRIITGLNGGLITTSDAKYRLKTDPTLQIKLIDGYWKLYREKR